ncbi:hypothetical protein PEBR_14103 [Penicillium brasilianum]|uniref:Uncharacterized protein n=1 Tax=Penicillium brasilianum TaxID=104259 RepID=A0A1S9RRL4_PENBI|nr:hypothetical protein PEBR_14103 [Penicillium brasilianum]
MGVPETFPPLPKEELAMQPVTVRYEYDPWLLDDHPLRSHPTECIPGLGTFLSEWCASLQCRWKEILLRTGCLLLACLAAFQCLNLFHSPSTGKGLPRPLVTSRINSREWHVRCTYPHSDPRSNALALSVAAGCDGLRTGAWLHDKELQMGPSNLGPSAIDHLPLRLDSIIAKLESGSSPRSSQISLIKSAGGLNQNDPFRTFMLVLDAGSALPEVFPNLISHLDTLRQRGYLSHWDGAEVVQRAVTVVVTGELGSNPDCSSSPYSDVFWSSEEGMIFAEDLANGQLSPICAT